jgi:hypothetical protein
MTDARNPGKRAVDGLDTLVGQEVEFTVVVTANSPLFGTLGRLIYVEKVPPGVRRAYGPGERLRVYAVGAQEAEDEGSYESLTWFVVRRDRVLAVQAGPADDSPFAVLVDLGDFKLRVRALPASGETPRGEAGS